MPLVPFTAANGQERVESRFALTWPLILRCLRSGAGILLTLTMQNFKQFCTGSASKSILAQECDQKLKATQLERFRSDT